jgi:hypothetical protein
MTNKLLKATLATVLVAALCHASTDRTAGGDQPLDQFKILLGGGLILSPGYMDFLDDFYTAAGYGNEGGLGWIDLYGGIEVRLNQQFGIIVGCDLWINGVDAVGGELDESYATAILIPSLYGQLYLNDSGTFYINAGINLPVPSTGSDYFDFSNDGLGFGLNAGVQFAEVFRVEAGYAYVPVTAEATPGNSFWPSENDYDFGGPQIRALLSF